MESVLEAISRALQLDDAERAHLLDLDRAARDGARPVRRRTPARHMRPSPPAHARRHELRSRVREERPARRRGTNALACGLLAEVLDTPVQPPNLARYCFLNPRSERF